MSRIFQILTWFIISLFLYLVFLVYSPFIISIFLGFSMYLLFRPIFNYIKGYFPARKILVSTITTTLVTVFFILPVFYVLTLFIQEILLFVQIVQDFLTYEKITMLEMQVRDFVSLLPINDAIITRVGNELRLYLESLTVNFIQRAPQYLLGLFGYVNHILLSILFLFIFTHYGKEIKKTFFLNIPFAKKTFLLLYIRILSITEALIKGTLLISILHGIFIVILFFTFGLSTPLLYAFLAAIASLIPIVGTMLVWIPAAVYLYLSDGLHVSLWIFIVLSWGGFILIENILKPYLLDKKLHLHPLLLFLSILGGIYQFGILGVVLGPFCITVFVVLWKTFIMQATININE